MTHILYLAHDLDDSAIWRRVNMLQTGKATVSVAGFRRRTGPLPGPARVLGQTHNAKMAQRALSVLKQRFRLRPASFDTRAPDVILCRNLEMLALAVPLYRAWSQDRPVSLVYEVLDIHRLMVGPSPISRALRGLERRLCRYVDRLVLSSPAFQTEYFDAYGQCDAPVLFLENKVVIPDAEQPGPGCQSRQVAAHFPLRIGWFGILRCRFSLRCLDRLTRARPGRYRVDMRGRPALDEMPDFHRIVEANPDMTFGGPYTYPDDLPELYGGVDLAWLVDQYDTGRNSTWLLPNRLYESGMNRVPPVALAGTETARRLGALGIGLILDAADEAHVQKALDQVSASKLEQLRQAQDAIPQDVWATTPQDARALVETLGPARPATQSALHGAASRDGVLIVVPTLNEANHIGAVVDGLAPFLQRRRDAQAPARLVVADGGSTDGTQAIVAQKIADLPQYDIRLMHNPARIQSAGINAACAEHGAGMGWLARLDAHSIYPADFVDILLDEAARTDAASIVVAMHAIGTTPLQQAIATTQNSRLGNGGAAHRTGGSGRYVDHGHHAVMRLDAFQSVGGYDDSFSHNEDAELDFRLARAGHRIWLTARTGLKYLPRGSVPALARQYFNFGRGRARTTLKHRLKPRLRQLAMIAVAPICALALLVPVTWLFALPAAIWLAACQSAGVTLAIGRRDLAALTAGPIAATMHLAWSAGFWRHLLWHDTPTRHPAPMPVTDQSDKPAPDHVAVGICTFRRASLGDTLRSLDQQDLPDGTRLSIIVVDNDDTPSAQPVVDRFAAQSRHQVIYRFAPQGNISIARNAALAEAEQRGFRTFAFIDDDEIAPASWLASLVSRLAETGVAAVVGPVRAVYAPNAPRWMQQARPHDTNPELLENGQPIAGHSCNVIMDLSHETLAGRRFDLARGVSGGEDTAFFREAMAQGAQLGFAPSAVLTEPVPAARATLTWLLKRRFRMGQTHGGLLRGHGGPGSRLRAMFPASAKVAYCLGAAVLCAPFPAPRNAHLLRGALHVGTLAALIGLRTVEIYGTAVEETRAAP